MAQTYADAPPLRHVSRFRLAEMQGQQDQQPPGSLLDFAPMLLQQSQAFAPQEPPKPRAQSPAARRPVTAQQPAGGTLNGMNLLFGDGPDATMQKTQDAGALNGVDLLFGDDAAPQNAEPSRAEPDAPTWIGRRMQDIRGRHDPREANTETVFDQFPGELRNATGNAAIFGASDAQMGDIIAKQLGDKLIRREQDANGYDVFVTRGPDGQEQRGYVNAPGLDSQDISRGIYGAMPYMVGGAGVGAAVKGAGTLARIGAYGASSGATSIAGDIAQKPMGSEQGIEGGKALFAAGAGALGVPAELIAAKVWGRYVIEPRLFNRSTGQLTPEGAKMAASQGLDPNAMQADISKTFAQTYAKTRDASQAAIKAQEGEFGIPSTVGQRTKIPRQLTEEEAMRRDLYGEDAGKIMRAFDREQSQAVDFAARTRMPSDFRSQSVRQTGTMSPGGITHVQQMPDNAADLGAGIQSGMRHARTMAEAGETAAWDAVTDVLPKKEAFDLLPDALAGRLGGVRVTAEMPKAAAMAKALDDYISGKAFSDPVAKVLQQSPVKTVDEMRRQLLGMYKGAADPTDQMAAKAIYDGFNDWIDQASQKLLIAGDPAAAANLRIARDTTRTMQNLFNPAIKGSPSPAGKLISALMDADSPERAAQILFGPSSSTTPSSIKPGAIEALRAMKAALQKYADPRIAGDTLADLKIAYWAHLVQSNKGAAHSPTVMLNNIKAAFANQRTMLQELFSPEELGQIRRLGAEFERITYKDPNPSGSGYTAAVLTKQFFGKLLDIIPFAREAFEYSGVPAAYNRVAAKRYVDQMVRQVPGNALPYTSSAGATYGRQGPTIDSQWALDRMARVSGGIGD